LGQSPDKLLLGSRHRVGLNNLYTEFAFHASLAFIVTVIKVSWAAQRAKGHRSLVISGQCNLPGVKLGDTLEGVNLRHGLVGPQTQNARESEGVATFVALRLLNVVEGHFHDHSRLNSSARAQIFDGMLQEIFCAGLDFRISESRIRFADSQKLVTVTYGKSVVGKQSMPLAMSIFDGGDDYIERCEGLFQLEPRSAPAARRI
jgi:hypothetical protein